MRMRLERETACDDAVLNAGVLLESVKALQRQPAPAFAGLAMARTGKLAQRLKAIMDKQRNRKPLTLIGIILLVLIALVVAVLVALPGARAKIAALIPQPPIPENQYLIVTKDKWRLRGPVKRVELYYGERWDNQTNPPLLMEVLEFDEAGRIVSQEDHTYGVYTSSWRYDRQGRLVAIDRKESPAVARLTRAPAHTPTPWEAYQYLNEALPYTYAGKPAQVTISYDKQGKILTQLTRLTQAALESSISITYNTQGDPVAINETGARFEHQATHITYAYDAMGNWTSQHRQKAYTFSQYLRRITYYPHATRNEEQQTDHYSRASLGLRGPVTAIEGPALIERLLTNGTPSRIGVPVNAYTDHVEFDQAGRVSSMEQWDGSPRPENLLEHEALSYDTQGIMRARTIKVMQASFRSYSATTMYGFMLGNTLLPHSPEFQYYRDSVYTYQYHYDNLGRLTEEQMNIGHDVAAHAVCRYSGNNDGLITVTGFDGKVTTDLIHLNITRDRYGNLLSRRYTWEIETGAPSTRTEEIRYRLTYADGLTDGLEPGTYKTRSIKATKDRLDGAFSITLSGPTPARLSPALLPLSSGMQVLYATETAAGWFPLPKQPGNFQATGIVNTDPRTGSVSAMIGAIGPTAQQGMVALEWDNSRTAGTIRFAWQLALHPITAVSGGMQRASTVPWSIIREEGMGSPTSAPVDIRHGHQNPQLIWFPERSSYLMVAENYEQSMPGITMAMVNTDGTLATSQTLRFRGYSPRLAKTRKGLVLCFVQRDRFPCFQSKGSIKFASSKDGTQWAQSRQLFPQLTHPKEVALTGDGHGTLYLLVLCHMMQAASGRTTPATLYGVVSRDNGVTWTMPKILAAYESEYIDEPSISLALDAKGKSWFAFSELGAKVDKDHPGRYIPGVRSSARMVVGSW